jgi:predicted nucleotidyltransferase component of viral defense system
MKLHNNRQDFENLIAVTAKYIGIPESAVKRDYYIVIMLQNLQNSEYACNCVFKGGTSLSKCYPGSIDRFSEDIDLTYVPEEGARLSGKAYSNELKKIEAVMIGTANSQKIDGERNDRNKSAWVWFEEKDAENSRLKLEIGSSVKPEPYSPKTLRTYIQQYLSDKGMQDVVEEYELQEVTVNTLNIERTFLDKVFAVKRHAVCATLGDKARHIYDVTKLFQIDEVQEFLSKKGELKELIRKTKATDSIYNEKRNIAKEYDPTEAYSFGSWSPNFSKDIRRIYESGLEELLYTEEKLDFDEAIDTFQKIDKLFTELGE